MVKEIALALEDLGSLTKQVWITADIPDPPPPVLTLVELVDRKKVGDIIAVREPGVGIGRKETHEYLWLTVRGKWSDIHALTKPWAENGVKYEKRRFCIPLDRLKEVYPDFDKNRALDLSDFYQPFNPTDKETGLFLFKNNKVFDIKGLVYDKEKGKYL